jgi:membrane protein
VGTRERLEELKRELVKAGGRWTPTSRPSGHGEGNRGREAKHPGEIPTQGWMDVFWRAWKQVSAANLFLVAGGVTYAILLALFPGLAGGVP